jgi:uncharacterized protein
MPDDPEIYRTKIDGPPDPHALFRAMMETIEAHRPSRVVLGEGKRAIILAEAKRTRRCGECSLCCVIAGVEPLQKPPYVACPHLEPGGKHGCGIYPNRPTACQQFACGWLMGNFDERFRPDKIGAYCAFFMTPEQGVYAVVQVDSSREHPKRVNQMIGKLRAVVPEIRVIWDDKSGVILRWGQPDERVRLLKREPGNFETTIYQRGGWDAQPRPG